jgi:hypothetical protein
VTVTMTITRPMTKRRVFKVEDKSTQMACRALSRSGLALTDSASRWLKSEGLSLGVSASVDGQAAESAS